MGWFTKTPRQYLAEAEYHRARAEIYEEKLKLIETVPAAWIMQIAADRGFEAKYRALAAQHDNTGGGA